MRLTAHTLDTTPPTSSSPTFLHGRWRFPLLVIALGGEMSRLQLVEKVVTKNLYYLMLLHRLLVL